ncbi:Rtf2 RING-finger-domain-containing protein [Achaetomium macrosporum]|uniref:Rtf2 RING-finger-domain-containing protein n=1 Tax=Achaetomium macrosporum TaxID=79813 RepID=A0AAN7H4S9_9PEZI|nr:Rtf2 RING-finger-domain-containing protein [Achaetomium macrosporum]
MGNDGGSIPTRRELVKSAARTPTVSELKATALENLTHAWSHDPLTSERLDMENVVSDWRGRLYNYESVLRGLIPSSDDDAAVAPELVNGESSELTFASTGIKSLRDVVKLKFRRYAPPGTKGREIWACPISLKELGPATRAVYLVPCGHVFAEAAIKQIQEKICPECSEGFKARDMIPILPTQEADLASLAARISNLRAEGLTHSLKKEKKNGKKKRKAEEGNGDEVVQSGESKGRGRDNETTTTAASKPNISSRVSGINNAMTASLTAKVLAEQEERNKRRKLAAAAK